MNGKYNSQDWDFFRISSVLSLVNIPSLCFVSAYVYKCIALRYDLLVHFCALYDFYDFYKSEFSMLPL